MSNDKFTKNSQKGIDLATLLQFPDEGYVWLMYDGKDYKIPASIIKTAVINSGGNTYATVTDLALKLDKIGGVIEKPHLSGGLETILAIKIDNSTNSIAFANGTSVNGVFIPTLVATVNTTGITGVGGINGNVPGGYWLTKINDASNFTEPAYRFDARNLGNQALEYRPLFGFGSANGDSFQVKANLDLDLLTHGIKNLKDPIDNQDAVTKKYFQDNLPSGGGANQDSIEFPVPTTYTYTGDYITKVVETITDGTIEKRLRYYISASPIVDGSPDIMEYKNSVTNFFARATYNYTAGKLTSITTETITAWTI